jgi:hypothetical protein
MTPLHIVLGLIKRICSLPILFPLKDKQAAATSFQKYQKGVRLSLLNPTQARQHLSCLHLCSSSSLSAPLPFRFLPSKPFCAKQPRSNVKICIIICFAFPDTLSKPQTRLIQVRRVTRQDYSFASSLLPLSAPPLLADLQRSIPLQASASYKNFNPQTDLRLQTAHSLTFIASSSAFRASSSPLTAPSCSRAFLSSSSLCLCCAACSSRCLSSSSPSRGIFSLSVTVMRAGVGACCRVRASVPG